ncbi:MAG: type IV pilus assembly protein PilM [Deltaproteobacteria bacterium]|jgi:type IV pilus assembly protein PilM|uniref:Type IV pilus assembly protein PilM n=1 Tax=Candidatus Acidulodesulfobacterium acidiphilum TaxID=2597224 RepID=A0A520X6U7_9DELT|nr:type IV pilus assembly protein PilM [Deltaproteobacteria bacterium]RZV36868.1 MAG: type IV pilus assembly protein PilM [Candidatus Acidulodesulfobacterium acidiphilum]
MALKFGIGSKKSVGIDIGSSSIKVIELSKSGHKYYIDVLDTIDLPSGAVGGGIVNDAASTASYLKNSLAKHGVSEKKVVIGIPCKHVIIKTIEMPKMKPSELESSIYYEAQRYITYDMNEVSLDYVVLGDSPSEPSNNAIMIIAGKKDIIENQSDFFHECGLNPYIIDVDCIALENMFNFNYPEEFDELISIVKIGASETNVHIIQKGTNLFRRDIPIGGINITEEIAKKFQINFNEAENIKTGNMGNRSEDFKSEFNIYLDMILTRVISEIHRTIDYFAANNDKQYPKKIYLTGGSALLGSILQEIESKINIPASNLNPFRNLLFKHESSDAIHNFFGVAVGLALRGAE